MTHNISPWQIPPVDAAAWNPNAIKDNLIKGKMVLAYKTFTDVEAFDMAEPGKKARIKEELSKQLAELILETKMVEFTQMIDPSTGDRVVRARCFLVPDGQVQIIREYNK